MDPPYLIASYPCRDCTDTALGQTAGRVPTMSERDPPRAALPYGMNRTDSASLVLVLHSALGGERLLQHRPRTGGQRAEDPLEILY